VEALVRRTAEEDGRHVHIWCEQEPGSSGKAQIDHYLRDVLPGFAFFGARSTGSKADRAMPLAAQAEGGAVRLVRCPWNGDFLDECETFPWGSHDDQVDAASLALAKLSRMPVVVPQPPAAFDQGKSDCYAADFSPRHRRVGATGLDSDYGFLAGGPGGYFQPGAMEEALAWPRYYTVAE
jgi:predicted phage terminase large subunit-like protein